MLWPTDSALALSKQYIHIPALNSNQFPTTGLLMEMDHTHFPGVKWTKYFHFNTMSSWEGSLYLGKYDKFLQVQHFDKSHYNLIREIISQNKSETKSISSATISCSFYHLQGPKEMQQTKHSTWHTQAPKYSKSFKSTRDKSNKYFIFYF